jgi:hypothetical protein
LPPAGVSGRRKRARNDDLCALSESESLLTSMKDMINIYIYTGPCASSQGRTRRKKATTGSDETSTRTRNLCFSVAAFFRRRRRCLRRTVLQPPRRRKGEVRRSRRRKGEVRRSLSSSASPPGTTPSRPPSHSCTPRSRTSSPSRGGDDEGRREVARRRRKPSAEGGTGGCISTSRVPQNPTTRAWTFASSWSGSRGTRRNRPSLCTGRRVPSCAGFRAGRPNGPSPPRSDIRTTSRSVLPRPTSSTVPSCPPFLRLRRPRSLGRLPTSRWPKRPLSCTLHLSRSSRRSTGGRRRPGSARSRVVRLTLTTAPRLCEISLRDAVG